MYSPQTLNSTIRPVAGLWYKGGAWSPTSDEARMSTTNETKMAHWRDMVEYFNTTDRVPVKEYSRTIPKLKPTGSAVTSVFVSTFVMLSTAWTAFSFVAGILGRMWGDRVAKREASLRSTSDSLLDLEKQGTDTETESLEPLLIENKTDPIKPMNASDEQWKSKMDAKFERLILTLRKGGVLAESYEDS
ncbi:hypothetical protein R3P38DRAFT_3450828 [Favolaschia claudopus]|uniref:Uncharacterized protein n=1 Tax=Favolaschia claudopus TaxID=2862362 RepID=A0AAV9ZL30_9AGAR